MIESLDWDPVVDPPATLAIIGGGPVGIEAAIYARFLGYHVSIFEQRRVAHRMLDWNNRRLDVVASECTTSLGHAAIAAQEPTYRPPEPTHVYSGKSYAEEYLLPLAKTDLVFDDIHFLSRIVDVSRLETRLDDVISMQERCNDEFRLVVDGRNRGPWTSQADVVIDCRGNDGEVMGLGPGGGVAIGERELRDSFLKHAPQDRKFEKKMVNDKHVVIAGYGRRACIFVNEFIDAVRMSEITNCRLTWLVHPDRARGSDLFNETIVRVEGDVQSPVHILESVGVERIMRSESSNDYVINVLKQDHSTVDLRCDSIASMLPTRYTPIGTELHSSIRQNIRNMPNPNDQHIEAMLTAEPGYYRLSGGNLEQGAGVGLKDAFLQIRKLFALISGRSDLDLYRIIELQNRVH